MVKRNMPKISIIVPAYNSEDFIESSIKSIINQTINDMETSYEKSTIN